MYENAIQQDNKNLIVSDKPFEELYSNENFNNAFSKLGKNKTSRSTALQGKNAVEEKYDFTFSNLPAKVIEANNKISYTFLIFSKNTKKESFDNLVIEVDSLQQVRAAIVKYNPKTVTTTFRNHVYFEGDIEVQPILSEYPKNSKTSKTKEYEIFCITEVVSACSKVPYDCHGDICGYTSVDICLLAGGGGGGIVSFGPAGSINNTGAINYGGGSSTSGTSGVQTNYITTIPVYDELQKQFVTSLGNLGNNFSQLNPLAQKIVFEYLSYNEFEDPIKTNVKDTLINIDLDWLKQQSALNQMSFMNFFIKNNFSLSSKNFVNDMIIEFKDSEITDQSKVSEVFNVTSYVYQNNYFNKSFDSNFYTAVDTDSSLNLTDINTALTFSRLFLVHCAVLKKENPNWSYTKVFARAYVDTVQVMLDIVGLVPVYGEVADLANGVIYTIQGDALNASLSFASTVPVAGWFASGIKFAKRSDGLKYLVTGTNNFINFGTYNSTKFRAVLGIAKGDATRQAHHIISRASRILEHPAIQKAAKATTNQGFHIDSALNGIPVATWRNQPNHNRYNDKIIEKLEAIPANLSANGTYSKVLEIIKDVKAVIVNNPNTHLNDLNFDI